MINKLHQIKHFLLHWLKASRGGHGVHSPFVFQLCEEVFYNQHSFYDFEKLNQLRQKLQADHREIEVMDLGAGSQKLSGQTRKVSDITKHGISTRKKSELLFRLIHVLKPKLLIELGTSIGLNAQYMHFAAKESELYTIEGNPALKKFAEDLATDHEAQHIHFLEGNFNEALPALLEQLGGFDLLYIDGNHQYQATLNYFHLALKYKHPGSVILLDDIYWSPAMTKAWEEIKTNPEVKLSLDLFHFGIVFFREEIKEKQDLRLAMD